MSNINGLIAAKIKASKTKKDTAKAIANVQPAKKDTSAKQAALSLLSKVQKNAGKDTSSLTGKSIKELIENATVQRVEADGVPGTKRTA